jgi:polyphenol oxidase
VPGGSLGSVTPSLTPPPPFELAGDHIAIALPGARALFTTRRGGTSTGPYTSLNLGWLTDDDPSAVTVNRGRLATAVGGEPIHGLQVHGSRVQRRTAPNSPSGPEEADGQATAVAGLAPMVLGADCVTIAIAGDGAVAAVHAGWRGLAAGVIAEGVAAVRELGAVGELAAAIGPAAGVCCYEVGEEVHAHFAADGAAVRRGRNLDLKAIAARRLRGAGVGTVHDVDLCTICAPDGLLYSHRRDAGITGRQAAVVWRT